MGPSWISILWCCQASSAAQRYSVGVSTGKGYNLVSRFFRAVASSGICQLTTPFSSPSPAGARKLPGMHLRAQHKPPRQGVAWRTPPETKSCSTEHFLPTMFQTNLPSSRLQNAWRNPTGAQKPKARRGLTFTTEILSSKWRTNRRQCLVHFSNLA